MSAIEPRDLPLLAVFAVVVRRGSFTEAARELGVSKSLVSDHVRTLEERHGVRLLERTSRKLALTQVGERVYAVAFGVLRATVDFGEIVEEYRHGPTGTLRVTASHDFVDRFVAPVAAALVNRYPTLSIDVIADDTRRDLISEQIDVAVRVGPSQDSNYVTQRLWTDPEIVVATPELLARFPDAVRPRDLLGAPWVVHARFAGRTTWRYTGSGGETDSVEFTARATGNSARAVRSLIVRGAGFGVLPRYTLVEDLAARRLVRVCPDWVRRYVDVCAVLPTRRQPPRVTMFLEMLRAVLACEGVERTAPG
jgi:DNA-binding transcriptional LysR family regulator